MYGGDGQDIMTTKVFYIRTGVMSWIESVQPCTLFELGTDGIWIKSNNTYEEK